MAQAIREDADALALTQRACRDLLRDLGAYGDIEPAEKLDELERPPLDRAGLRALARQHRREAQSP